MSGFAHDIAGGQGKLIITQLQSPNFDQATETGWAILKDGDAFFYNITAKGNVTAEQMFLYSGTPAKGSLFLALSQTAGTDAYGNNYGQGLNIGVWSAVTGNQEQHFGVDDQGNLYLADVAGDTRIYLSPGNVLLAFYTAGTAAVVMSMAPAAVTDPLTSDAVQPGFNVYGQGTNAGKRVQMALDSNSDPVFMAVTGETDEAVPAQWSTAIFNAGQADQFLFTQIVGPVNSNQIDVAGIEMQSSADDKSGAAGGNLIYRSAGGTQTNLLEWGGGGIFASNVLDQQSYDIQRRTLFAVGQNISSSSNVNVSGMTSNLASGQTYRFRAKIMLQCVSAATPVIEFSGPALGSLELDWIMQAVLNSNSSNALSFTWRTVSVLGGITGVAMASTALWTVYIDGQITPSAAGTLQVIARTTGSGNYNIIAGSYMDLMPVTV